MSLRHRKIAWFSGLGGVAVAVTALLVVASATPSGALVLPGTGSTTTIWDGGDDPVVTTSSTTTTTAVPGPVPTDAWIGSDLAANPSVAVPVVISLKVTWSAGPLTPAAEAAQKARITAAQQQVSALIMAPNATTTTAKSVIASDQVTISPVLFAALGPAGLAAIRTSPLVRSIGYDRLMQDLGSDQSADTSNSRLLGGPPITLPTDAQVKTNVLGLHQAGITGAGSTVAVIDTGVDPNVDPSVDPNTDQPGYWLAGKVIDGVCFSHSYRDPTKETPRCKDGSGARVDHAEGVAASGKCDATDLRNQLGQAIDPISADFWTKWCWHGSGIATDIAGLRGTLGQSGAELRGLAPGASLLSIAAYHMTTECSHSELQILAWCAGVSISDLHRSLQWVLDHRTAYNIASVNMSMGWFNFADAGQDADCDSGSAADNGVTIADLKSDFDALRSVNITPVAAAGNWNNAAWYINSTITVAQKRPRIYPSCISSVVSAGGTVPSSDVAWFASQGGRGIDLLAPAGEMGAASGTSGATANISAAAALLRQAVPSVSSSDLEATLKATGDQKYMKDAPWPVGWNTSEAARSKPRINVARSVAALRGLGVVPVAQSRIADSRIGLGTECPSGAFRKSSTGTVRRLKVTGTGGIPTNAMGVVVNVTAADTTATSFATVWGAALAGETVPSRPDTSTMNWQSGLIVSNVVTAAPDADGCISIYNQNGDANIIVDAMGYLSEVAPNAGVTALASPVRVFDASGKSGRFEVPITGAGLPSGITSVWVSLSAASSSAGSAAALGPVMTATTPNVLGSSNINFTPGLSTTALALVQVVNGKIAVHNSVGSARFVVDVLAYSTSTAATSDRLSLTQPTRILNTRTDGGGKVGTGGRTVTVPDLLGPSAGIKAVMVNLTATEASGSTYLTAWSGSGAQPAVSQAQITAGRDTATTAIVPVTYIAGKPTFKVTPGGGTTHIVIDLIGYIK